jgi:hypothetical protein
MSQSLWYRHHEPLGLGKKAPLLLTQLSLLVYYLEVRPTQLWNRKTVLGRRVFVTCPRTNLPKKAKLQLSQVVACLSKEVANLTGECKQ